MSRPRPLQGSIGSAIEERVGRIRAPSYSFDDLTRRRARKQRNSRIGSALVALVLVAAVLAILRSVGGIGWPGGLPASPNIERTNAGRLHLAWTASTPWPVYTPPAAGEGRIYAGFADGTVKAFPAFCRRPRCSPLWSGPTIATTLSPPTVAGGIVYAASGATTRSTGLFAYGVDCGSGGATCHPLWTGVVPADVQARYVDDVAPLVTADVVVIVASGRPAPADELIAFPRTCATPTCGPRWLAPLGAPDLAGKVERPGALVTDGRVVYVAAGAELEAFDPACASNGHLCHPMWVDRLPAPIQQPPILADGIIYVGAGGVVYGFPASCGGPSCGVVRSVSFESAASHPISSFAIIGDLVVAGSSSGVIEAVPFECRSDLAAGCRSAWSATTFPSPTVTIGDGLIFVAAADGVYAFDPACASGGPVCRPIWFAPRKDATVTVTRRAVFVGSSDGRLSAFTIPAA